MKPTGYRRWLGSHHHIEVCERLKNRVLVVSMPRAGTTWVGQTLGRTDATCYVGEPDNERKEPFALRAKRDVGRFPALNAQDDAPDYAHLWDLAFQGRVGGKAFRERASRKILAATSPAEVRSATCPPDAARSLRLRLIGALAVPPTRRQSANNVVVKSVYAPMCLEWLARRYVPRVLIVLRHPLNMIASWVGLGYKHCCLDQNPAVRKKFVDPLGLPLPEAGASPLARIAWEVGLINSVLEDARRRHADWRTVTHERLCRDPIGEFRSVAEHLALDWSSEAERFLLDSNRPGMGYRPQRIASEQPQRWRERLDEDQVAEIVSVLRRFPLDSWFSEPVTNA